MSVRGHNCKIIGGQCEGQTRVNLLICQRCVFVTDYSVKQRTVVLMCFRQNIKSGNKHGEW